jgi:ubiquinone biosynthesis protein UbiJ
MDKGITIASSTLTTQINGKVYKVDFGDPQLQQDLLDFSMRLATVDVRTIEGHVYQWISNELHGFFVRLLGEEAVAEVFADKKRSVLGQLQLFAYLNEEMAKVEAVVALEKRLGTYSAAQTK